MSITVILPISRTDYLYEVFNCLADLEKPTSTELIIVTDGDKNLKKEVDSALDMLNFRRIRVLEFGVSPAEDIESRRYRISAIHNMLKHYIPEACDYVLSVEDDTTFPCYALTRLKESIEQNENCVFAQGVQLGRRNSPYIGAWRTDDLYEPSVIESVLPTTVGGYNLHIHDFIDAGGLYCALIDADLYKIHTFAPFDAEGWNGLSCDLNFGLYLRQQGYQCVMNNQVVCGHLTEKGSIDLTNTEPDQVVFNKVNDKWKASFV